MIGVCIKYFHENYGGMLQAFATVSVLEARGLEYELIRYEKKVTACSIIKYFPRLLNKVLLNDKYEAFLKWKGMKQHPDFAKNDSIRMKAFRRFNETHFIKLSPVFVGYDALCKGAYRYSAVITGSDQLWSPAGLPTNYYNLMFVPNNIRKISYASSFGVKDIPWYQKKRTARFLERIEYISMRENRGSEMVKELTGREVPTILDPVLMFDRDEWSSLIPHKKEIDESYIFAYFLGNNPEHREVTRMAAQKLNCKIVALRHIDQYVAEDENFGDYALYDVGPDKFLNLLWGADFVCTDSFHGTCFSVIFRKSFVVFNRYSEESRYSKNTRIDTLCENLGLQNRRYKNAASIVGQLKECVDYDLVDIRLNRLKAITDAYLDEALKNVG